MPKITVYDASGKVQTLAWARAKYGPFVIYPAPAGDGPVWRLAALREKNDAAFVARTLDPAGKPIPGPRICFYWPDAPRLDDAGPLGAPLDGITPGRAVSGYANVNGDVGFGMGPGAHYFPQNGERGPHAAWLHGADTRSDVLLGIGMIPDDHLHLNAEWVLVRTEDPEPPEEPEGLVESLQDLAAALRGIATALEDPAHE